jgi:hypothetical protein
MSHFISVCRKSTLSNRFLENPPNVNLIDFTDFKVPSMNYLLTADEKNLLYIFTDWLITGVYFSNRCIFHHHLSKMIKVSELPRPSADLETSRTNIRL